MTPRTQRSTRSRPNLSPISLLLLALATAGSCSPLLAQELYSILPGAPAGAQATTIDPVCPHYGEQVGARADHPDEIVAAVYGAFECALFKSGYDVQLELSDFRTIPRAEFDQYHLQDLLTIVSESHLQVSRSETDLPGGTPLGVTYEAKWLDDTSARDDPNRDYNPRLDEGFRLRREKVGGPPVLSITAYQVHLNVLGKSITYRAYVLWTDEGSDGRATLIVNDHVADWVWYTGSEAVPIYPEDMLQRMLEKVMEQMSEDANQENSDLRDSGQCVHEDRQFYYPAVTLTGDEGHATGNHRTYAALHYQCSCNTSCTSQVFPNWSARDCVDVGAIHGVGLDHFRNVAQQIQPDIHPEAFDRGAHGYAVSGCFIQECVFTGCSTHLSITAVTGDFGVSLTASGPNQVWQGVIPFNAECGRCDRAQPFPLHPGAHGRGPFNRTVEDMRGGGGGDSNGPCAFFCFPRFTQDPTSCQPSPPPCEVEHCELDCPD